MRIIITCLSAAAIGLSGCATSKSSFYANPDKQNDSSICRVLLETTDGQFYRDAYAELQSRGVSLDDCQAIVARQNAILAGIAIAGAAVAVGVAANNGGLGGGYTERGVAWDHFRNEYYQTMWRCRDIATGRFVDDYRCSHLAKIDSRWPG